jgi:ParB family chromosome partitioning protein
MDIIKGEGIRVNLREMAKGPGPYTMSYEFDLNGLCESIEKAGLINPPLVARNQTGSLDIVTGFRRILALKNLGECEALCRDVTTALPSPADRFLAAFYDNLATRAFNNIEKAMILSKLRQLVPDEQVVNSFMPLLSLPSREGTLKFYLKLLDLDGPVQKAVAREEISIKAAKAFADMETNSREALFHWVTVLKFNINQQINFIENVSDISIREGLTTRELLSEDSFMKLVENPSLNTPQKAKAVLEALKMRRLPRLAQAQEAVARTVKAIQMPPGTSIHYDPYLEDPNYRLEVKFRSGKDLRMAINRLHALNELEAIPELWADI